MDLKPTSVMTRRLTALILFAALAGPVGAQVLGRTAERQTTGAGGYYINALPNEPTIRVAVRGDVPRTGVYDLGAGFDLEALVALAGGPTVEDLDPRDPTVAVRLFRPGAGGREVAFSTDYEALASGVTTAPALADGDVVEVQTEFERGVYVWGAVRNPGYFEVGPEVDAVRLLALAGGPQGDGARAQNVVTDATVIITRPGAGTVYQASLEAFVTGADVPDLSDGDALQVEVVQRSRFTFRDALSVATTVGTLVIIGLQIRATTADG